MVRDVLLFAVASPLLITFGLCLAEKWSRRMLISKRLQPDGATTPSLDTHRSWAAAVGMAASQLAAQWALHGRPTGEFLESWEWLLVLVSAAAVVGVLIGCVHLPRAVTVVLFGALAIAAGALTVPDFVAPRMAWCAALATVVFVLCIAQHEAAQRLHSIALPVVWVIVGSAAVPILLASANAKFAFFATAVAAAAGGGCLGWLALRLDAIAGSAVPVASVIVPVLLAAGYFNDYGDVPWVSFMFATLAPLALPIAGRLVPLSSHPWRATFLGLCAVIGLCGAAVAIALPALLRDPAW